MDTMGPQLGGVFDPSNEQSLSQVLEVVALDEL